jgi:hypothetical protein
VNSTTLNITPLQESLPQGCTAIIGGSTAILREHCQRKDREIKVRPLKIPIARNTVLNFGYKNESGWQSGGSVVVSESVLENSLTIPIFPYAGINPIPTDSLAYFGNLPITSFYLVLDSSETEDLETGEDYGCDVMARGTDGATKKIIQIKKIKLLDTWTDF